MFSSSRYAASLRISNVAQLKDKILESSIEWQGFTFQNLESKIIFASSNMKENLTLDQVLNEVDTSMDNVVLSTYAEHVSKSFNCDADIVRCIGRWTDGAEQSVMVTLPSSVPDTSSTCLASMIGKAFNQKCVATYCDDIHGNDYLYRFSFNQQLAVDAIDEILNRYGLVNKTILGHEHHEVVIIDEGRKSFESILRLKDDFGLNIAYSKGTSEFIGYYNPDEDLSDQEARQKSADYFSRLINTYFADELVEEDQRIIPLFNSQIFAL